jgi:hypothetical protein
MTGHRSAKQIPLKVLLCASASLRLCVENILIELAPLSRLKIPAGFADASKLISLCFMKTISVLWFGLALALVADAAEQSAAPPRPIDVSFRNEVQRAIDKGLESLKASQNSNGWWSTPDHPSVTALAVSAFMGDPSRRHRNAPELKKGYAFVLSCVKPDGGIYTSAGLANYNTSISMMALLVAHDPQYDAILRKARNYVIGMQADLGTKGKTRYALRRRCRLRQPRESFRHEQHTRCPRSALLQPASPRRQKFR